MTRIPATARVAPATAPPVVVRSRRGFWLGRGLGAVVLAGACAWSLDSSPGLVAVVGGVGALMFGAFALYALRQLLRGGPRLVLDADGVDAADFGLGPIAWREIGHVEQFGSAEAPFIAFALKDPARYHARLPPWPRLIARLHGWSGMPLLSVNLIGVDREPAEVAMRARTWWAAASGA